MWQHGESLLAQLDAKVGEKILDLGCGPGQLSEKIAANGVQVVGIDSDRAMIAQAKENYPQNNYPQISFQVADATNFKLLEPVDAVFSNAALHWVTPPEAAAHCIAQALKPGGRLVAEFGGKGNVKTIVAALEQVSGRSGLNPWYFPSISEYSAILEQAGLEVVYAHLCDRPTPLKSAGLAGWLTMFGQRFFADLSESEWADMVKATEATVPQLYQDGEWVADYRRLRVVAIKGSPI